MENRCGLDVAITYISGKWKSMLLFHLQSDRRRFGELRRLVRGISEKVLIQQLNELVDDEIVQKHVYEQAIPKVEYEVTVLGLTLIDALQPLCAWGNANRDRRKKQDQA
jgi:DNA-binding HxlR family transcriptional regulator